MILIIDDEKRYIESYALELRFEGYEVEILTDVDNAMVRLERSPMDIELIILDIMMPPGELFTDEDTEDGRRTGLRLIERIRMLTDPNLPVYILTNVSDIRVEKLFAEKTAVWFSRKEDILPFELARTIKTILDRSHFSR